MIYHLRADSKQDVLNHSIAWYYHIDSQQLIKLVDSLYPFQYINSRNLLGFHQYMISSPTMEQGKRAGL